MTMELLFSPLDTRYSKDIPRALSEGSSLEAQVEVEKAWLFALMEAGLCPKLEPTKLDSILANVQQSEIDEIEKRTQHATRALVETLMERLKKAGHPEVANWVHVGITSFDTVDTALRLRLKRYMLGDAKTHLEALKKELRRWARTHQKTPQVGRTHGQWAVPGYFGLPFAEAHERISEIEKPLWAAVGRLRGQSSGAVGGYQATSCLVANPIDLEEKFLKALDLTPHYSSTQILPPEDILEVAQNLLSICSVVAKLATDLRHLARSEIGEIAEGLSEGQVGSSTMPQKRNPWNLEHVCSLYKVLLSRLSLLQSDLVSEHHRDLTNSASSRFYFEFFAVAHLMVMRLTRVLKRLEAYPANMQKHLDAAGSSVLAEAFYVLGTKHGVDDAHDAVRRAARESERDGGTLFDKLVQNKTLPSDLKIEALRQNLLRGSELKFARIAKNWPQE